MEHRGSVLSSFDVFSNVPGTVLCLLWMYKNKSSGQKNTGIRDGEDGKERSEDVIYRRILRISEA